MSNGDEGEKLPARILLPGNIPQAPESALATATRRAWLKGAAIGAATVFVGSQWAPWLIDKGIEGYGALTRDPAEAVKKAERARELFQELFGAPAMLRHSHAGAHPDNLAVELNLRRAFRLEGEQRQDPQGRMRRLANANADLVLYGGPNSTLMTMLAWEFSGPNGRELDRDHDPCIPLRFYGISNEKDRSIPAYRIRYINASGQAELDLPWPLVDTHDDMKPYVPKPGELLAEDGGVKLYRPTEDNLIVTRMPNFFAPPGPTHPSLWPQLIVLEGSNGIGTRAAELLVQAEGMEALALLKKKLNGATAFQALFRVYGLEQTSAGPHRYTRIELRESSVTPLDLPPQLLQTAFDKAMSRLANSGGGIRT